MLKSLKRKLRKKPSFSSSSKSSAQKGTSAKPHISEPQLTSATYEAEVVSPPTTSNNHIITHHTISNGTITTPPTMAPTTLPISKLMTVSETRNIPQVNQASYGNVSYKTPIIKTTTVPIPSPTVYSSPQSPAMIQTITSPQLSQTSPLKSILRLSSSSELSSDSEYSESSTTSSSGPTSPNNGGSQSRSVAFLDQVVLRQERLDQLSQSINETLRNSQGKLGIQRRSYHDYDDMRSSDIPSPNSPLSTFSINSNNNGNTGQQKSNDSQINGKHKKSKAPPPPSTLESISENVQPEHIVSNNTLLSRTAGYLNGSQQRPVEYDAQTLTPGSSTETLSNGHQSTRYFENGVYGSASNSSSCSSHVVKHRHTRLPISSGPLQSFFARECADGSSQEDDSTSSESTQNDYRFTQLSELQKIERSSISEYKHAPMKPVQKPRCSVVIEKDSDNDSSVVLECQTFEPYVQPSQVRSPPKRLNVSNGFVTLPSKPIIQTSRYGPQTNVPYNYDPHPPSFTLSHQPIEFVQKSNLPITPISFEPTRTYHVEQHFQDRQQQPQQHIPQKPVTKHNSLRQKINSSLSKAFGSLTLKSSKTRKSLGSTFDLSDAPKPINNGRLPQFGGSAYNLSSVEMSESMDFAEPNRKVANLNSRSKGPAQTVDQNPWRHVASRSHENLSTINPAFLENNLSAYELTPRAAAVRSGGQFHPGNDFDVLPAGADFNRQQCIRSATFSSADRFATNSNNHYTIS